MKPVFTDKYKADWADENNPTDTELNIAKFNKI